MTPKLSSDQRIAKHKDFLSANWRGLASFAWEHYQSKGKGIVIVDEADFVFADRPQLVPLKFRYMGVGDPEMNNFPDWNVSKEKSWIEEYDPAEKVIVVVLRYDSSISSYFIGSKPAPPDCFKLTVAKNN